MKVQYFQKPQNCTSKQWLSDIMGVVSPLTEAQPAVEASGNNSNDFYGNRLNIKLLCQDMVNTGNAGRKRHPS